MATPPEGSTPSSDAQGTLGQIAHELRREPPLLYGLGIVIALLLLGAWLADEAVLVVVAVVVIVLAALGAWLMVQLRSRRVPTPPTDRATADAQRDMRATGGGRIASPDDVPPGRAVEANARAGGDMIAESGGRIASAGGGAPATDEPRADRRDEHG